MKLYVIIQTLDFWLLRYIQIHQAMLAERSMTLKVITMETIDKSK